MTALDRIFEQAWNEVSAGRASVEEVIQRYPEHARELQQLLETARWVENGAKIRAPASLRAAGRRDLIAHMAASRSPRRPRYTLWEGLFRRRLAPALAGLALVLTVGTAAAQSAEPGDLLYGWRQASEVAFLAASPEKASAALAIADRRAEDVLEAPRPSSEFELALSAYQAWLKRIEGHGLLTPDVLQQLGTHRQRFLNEGIEVPLLDDVTGSESGEAIFPVPELTPNLIPTLLPDLEDPLDLLD